MSLVVTVLQHILKPLLELAHQSLGVFYRMAFFPIVKRKFAEIFVENQILSQNLNFYSRSTCVRNGGSFCGKSDLVNLHQAVTKILIIP